MARPEYYIQGTERPGDYSLAHFVVCILYILTDIQLGRQDGRRDASLAKLTKNATTSRRIFAAIFALLALFFTVVVVYYQETYFWALDRSGVRDKRDQPRSAYPFFFEEHLDRLPLMFQVLHLRAWAGEADIPQPEWAYFLWWAQQYFAGLMTFSIFLLVQSRVRQLRTLTMIAFLWIAMTSLSCAHCLLFLFILTTPPERKRTRFDPLWLRLCISGVSLFHALLVYRMPSVLNSSIFQLLLLWALAMPLTMPALLWLISDMESWSLRFLTIHGAQVDAFFVSGLCSLGLHLRTTYLTFIAPTVVTPNEDISRFYVNRLDVSRRRSELGLAGLLHFDPSLGAVAWDVMFTFIALLIWTVVSSASIWGMVRSTMNPYIITKQIPYWDNMDDIVFEGNTRRQMASVRIVYRQHRSRYTDQEMIEEWENRGRAGTNPREAPRPRYQSPDMSIRTYEERSKGAPVPPHQNVAIAMFLGLVGGLGYTAAGALGAGSDVLDA